MSQPSGYSGTPLARKLGIRPRQRLVLTAAPAGWSVPELPDGVTVAREPHGATAEPAELIVAFHRDLASLRESIPALAPRIFSDGAIWAAWPRRAGGHDSDITENDVRAVALPLGLVDVKVAALDEDWSGLRLVWRREHRRAPQPPRG